jgi:CelD/BcsL family acetyltransferase involved in cellulose biosynthesis
MSAWQLYSIREFNRFRDTWGSLNDSGPDSAFLDPDFIGPLIDVFASGDEVLAVCLDGQQPVAMALLRRKNAFVWESFQPSQCALCPWVMQRDRKLPVLAHSLLKALPGYAVLLGLTQLDPDIYPRPEDDHTIRSIDHIRTTRISVRGDFDSYWRERGKNLRKNLRRQRNLLERENINTRLDVITDPSAVAEAVRQYGDIESAGWKGAEGSAIHNDNDQGRFYTEMLTRLCRKGHGRIYRYWFNDKIVAMNLCTQRNGQLIILKTTYDESETSTSPTMLMRQDAFGNIFDRSEFRVIEFYGRVLDWHTKWSSEFRTLYHMNCRRNALISSMISLLKKVSGSLK